MSLELIIIIFLVIALLLTAWASKSMKDMVNSWFSYRLFLKVKPNSDKITDKLLTRIKQNSQWGDFSEDLKEEIVLKIKRFSSWNFEIIEHSNEAFGRVFFVKVFNESKLDSVIEIRDQRNQSSEKLNFSDEVTRELADPAILKLLSDKDKEYTELKFSLDRDGNFAIFLSGLEDKKVIYTQGFPFINIFEFLFHIQDALNMPSEYFVSKWPDSFYEKFQKLDLKPELYKLDHKENLIEAKSEQFYKKWGRPKAVYLTDIPMKFKSANDDQYEIKLEATKVDDPNAKPGERFQFLPSLSRRNPEVPTSHNY